MTLPALPAGASDIAAEWVPAALPQTLQFDIASRHTDARYRILIGLPHAAAPAQGYPVLWMLDGGASYPPASLFRPRSDDAFQGSRRERPQAARPAGVIVAISNLHDRPFDVDGRARDYTPVPDATTGDRLSPEFGGAAAFRRFLVEELRPRIAERFPLDPRRNTLFGFSYGGLFTMDTLLEDPRHFQRYWAASPSLWFSEAMLPRRITQAPRLTGALPQRVMLTVGEDEQYPAAAVPAERQAHLDRRGIVDHVKRTGAQLSNANPTVQIEVVVARDHDHFDMLMHGARRVIDFAFAP